MQTIKHCLYLLFVGALETDFPADDETLKRDIDVHDSLGHTSAPGGPKENPAAGDSAENMSIGNITFVQCATGTTSKSGSFSGSPTHTPGESPGMRIISVHLHFIFIENFLFC